ncbi:hypothetical protein ACEQ8H_007295 [Pleosporales sp. CAS-2024a]
MATNDQPQYRTFFGQLFDRVAAWKLGFPPERCNYTTREVRIPVSDGRSSIELCGRLLQPVQDKPLGTVLVRSPYGRGLPMVGMARAYAARGYQVLSVSCRGTFGSGGEFEPFWTEVQDGKEVVEWMRQQPWYTGTFATIGSSYLGFTQWALLCDPPKDMVAAVPAICPYDFSRPIWGTGALDLDNMRWVDMVAHQEDPFSLWESMRKTRVRKLEAIFGGTEPLAQSLLKHNDGRSPWLATFLTKPDVSDAFYEPMKLHRALEQADIPILIITGWYDLFIEQSMEQYYRLQARGCQVALTIGPWTHMGSGFAPQMNLHGFDWVEHHLSKRSAAERSSPVQYFVTGAQQWKEAAIFPPPTKPTTLFLHHGGQLLDKPAPSETAASQFTFDPRNPTPTTGGIGLTASTNGSVDDSALAARSDVLVFDSAPLPADVELCGKPVVELTHSTSSPYADMFVRVSEVDARGKSRNISDVFERLDPKRGHVVDLKLGLNHCAHRIVQGKRIRVMVAGGSFPQFARNHGVENADLNATEMRPVEHTVYHGKLVLPVV